jgi:hypothetical protein
MVAAAVAAVEMVNKSFGSHPTAIFGIEDRHQESEQQRVEVTFFTIIKSQNLSTIQYGVWPNKNFDPKRGDLNILAKFVEVLGSNPPRAQRGKYGSERAEVTPAATGV